MSGQADKAQRERERYVKAFNDTMVRIWRERITMLGIIDTGALYRSVMGVGVDADDKFTNITLRQKFLLYGLYVDAGVGSNTPIGNPGDIGRDNPRKRSLWFSRKYYASMMRLKEFMADNMGEQAAEVVGNALSREIIGRFL